MRPLRYQDTLPRFERGVKASNLDLPSAITTPGQVPCGIQRPPSGPFIPFGFSPTSGYFPHLCEKWAATGVTNPRRSPQKPGTLPLSYAASFRAQSAESNRISGLKPQGGLEPPTSCLRNRRSAIELPRPTQVQGNHPRFRFPGNAKIASWKAWALPVRRFDTPTISQTPPTGLLRLLLTETGHGVGELNAS